MILRHENTRFYCDSAYLNNKGNNFEAFGNVHINVNDSIDVYGDRMIYEGNTKIAELFDGMAYIYVECGLDEGWQNSVEQTIVALARFNHEHKPRVAFKIRCGGVTPEAFPSLDQVAFVLATCIQHDVPFKATAGLHHPVRHFNGSVRTFMHGFINVFGAAILGYHMHLDADQLKPILAETDIRAFSFTSDGFSRGTYHATIPQIKAARANFAHSYGSCSFDEPREDLKQEGLRFTFETI